jgi:hypothetical protein
MRETRPSARAGRTGGAAGFQPHPLATSRPNSGDLYITLMSGAPKFAPQDQTRYRPARGGFTLQAVHGPAQQCADGYPSLSPAIAHHLGVTTQTVSARSAYP